MSVQTATNLLSAPHMNGGRIGGWGCTVKGDRCFPCDARPGDFDIEAIGHALANLCRFGGHTRKFYSIGEHAVHVSYECCPRYALDGLLHDASEGWYLVDLPRPLKLAPGMEPYLAFERQAEEALAVHFGIRPEMPACVKRADEQLLATEARDLMPQDGPGGVRGWALPYEPLPHLDLTRPWSPTKARRRFLRRYRELTGSLTRTDRFIIAVRRLLGMESCR
jgi:hypothetical protein